MSFMKWRKYYWYLSTFWKKHGLVMIGSIVMAIVVFSIFIPVIARLMERKKVTHIGMIGNYTLSTLPEEIQKQISLGLTQIKEDGSVAPSLSTRWSIEDEGQTYRFIIKDSVFWQDGAPLKPQDIQYKLDNVETIATTNDVVFKLPDQYVPFPTIVSQPLLRYEEEPFLFFFKKPKIIGLGEYRVTNFTNQANRLKEIIIENDQERKRYRFYLTENDAIMAFKKGEINVLQDLSTPPDVSSWSTTQTDEKIHPERYLAIFFNLENQMFSKNVRQALSYALTKNNTDIRAIGPISPLSWAYIEGKTYDYDLDRAIERLLDGLPEVPLEFELITPTVYETKAETIIREWQDFGQKAFDECMKKKEIKTKDKCGNLKIKVQIRISNFPDTSNFQTMLIGQETPPDPDQYFLWHSEQSTNFSHYKNTRIDSLLEKGRQVVDKQERKTLYQEFQQFLLEDAPAIFLEHLVSYQVTRK